MEQFLGAILTNNITHLRLYLIHCSCSMFLCEHLLKWSWPRRQTSYSLPRLRFPATGRLHANCLSPRFNPKCSSGNWPDGFFHSRSSPRTIRTTSSNFNWMLGTVLNLTTTQTGACVLSSFRRSAKISLSYSKPKPAEADVQALAQTILLKLFNTTEKLAKRDNVLAYQKAHGYVHALSLPQRHRPTHDRRDRLFHDLWTRCRRSSLCLWRTSHPKASTSRATL